MIAVDPDYCPLCGTTVERREIDGRERAFCPDCERVLWRNAVPGVTVAVVDANTGRVCCIRRGRPPHEGAWALPGGHLEHDEEPPAGAARELEEETGLRVDPGKLAVFATRLSSGAERNHAVVHFAARREDVTGEPGPSEEAADVAFLTPEEYDECEALVHDRRTVEAAIAEF